MSAASPRRRRRPPSYRHHKGSGQAVVTLNGKDFYLGVHGTPASRQMYDRLIAEWYANGRQVMPKAGPNNSVTVNELVGRFWLYAESYYVGPDGQPTGDWTITSWPSAHWSSSTAKHPPPISGRLL